ncbi:MAG: TIGR03808 family TAT-translocated repetitive protein [Rhizobiaceae bacterium]|nr:TIGR03808 family TAT-translocated repetitive protein [Rhizobiaceae bacterium]
MTVLSRRGFATAGLAATGAVVAGPVAAQGVSFGELRGGLDAAAEGVRPDASGDQSGAFRRLLAKASDGNHPILLGPGAYFFADIELPARTRLSGVAGATRILMTGGSLFSARGAERVELRGLVLDGVGRPLGGGRRALLDIAGVSELDVVDCRFENSGGIAIALDTVSGRIERCAISGAADTAIYAVDSRGLAIAGNAVADCGNGGILVHRRQPGEDRTLVSGNRIERIRADNGGTGQWGNGINVFRAGGVVVSGNIISDCAFSAIRSNGGSNVQISGNQCLRSGETGLYSEFIFEGALIANNVVDGAANGISAVNFNEGGRLAVISGNLVRNLSTTGPYPADAPGFGVGITVEADTVASGNVVENAPLYGMHLGWGPYLRNVVATGNMIRNSAEGIAVTVVEGAGSAVISDNIISGAQRGAIVGHRWKEAASGDLAAAGAARFKHLSISGNLAS